MSTEWEIRSEIIFPKAQIAEDKDGGFPEKLEFVSRYQEGVSIKIDDTVICMRKWDIGKNDIKNLQGQVCESVMLVCRLEADNGFEALEASMPYIEWACDQLSFYAQFPVSIVSNQFVSLNDESKKHVFPMPRQSAKFRSSQYHNKHIPVEIPLVGIPDHFSERDLAALRWYHKSLAATYEVDRFIFLWVCLEILCKISGDSVQAPYVNSCGHKIENCPRCGRSTEREVNGKTLQLYLSEQLKVKEEVAKKMWQFRQLLHGQNKLTEKSTKEMEKLIMALQSSVCLAIKRRFGFGDDDPPIVLPEGLTISSIGLGIAVKSDA